MHEAVIARFYPRGSVHALEANLPAPQGARVLDLRVRYLNATVITKDGTASDEGLHHEE
jgi:hypothetical protein